MAAVTLVLQAEEPTAAALLRRIGCAIDVLERTAHLCFGRAEKLGIGTHRARVRAAFEHGARKHNRRKQGRALQKLTASEQRLLTQLPGDACATCWGRITKPGTAANWMTVESDVH